MLWFIGIRTVWNGGLSVFISLILSKDKSWLQDGPVLLDFGFCFSRRSSLNWATHFAWPSPCETVRLQESGVASSSRLHCFYSWSKLKFRMNRFCYVWVDRELRDKQLQNSTCKNCKYRSFSYFENSVETMPLKWKEKWINWTSPNPDGMLFYLIIFGKIKRTYNFISKFY